MPDKYYTISALTGYLKAKIEKDDALQRILLQAELSNFKRHSSGHLYFSLKDDKAQIAAVMFRTDAQRLNFNPKDGDKVQLEGRVSVYEANGQNQVYVQRMNLDGIGDLYQRYEQLKSRLREAGWFNDSRKRPIPEIPTVIGVITSPTGAAIHDIIHILSRRYPLARVLVYPALVQGIDAKFSIKAQIEKANADRLADVLIVGRGGGSIEDLWAFNEEIVLKAILDSRIPIVSAVGHETDNTLADYVADLRAPTPSGAAELVVPDQIELKQTIQSLHDRIKRSMNRLLQTDQKQLDVLYQNNVFREPYRLMERKVVQFDHLCERLEQAKPDKILKRNHERLDNQRDRLQRFIHQIVDNRRLTHQNLIGKLEAMSPLQVLKQGYTLVRQEEKLVSRLTQLDDKRNVNIRFYDGEAVCNVISIRKDLIDHGK
jgi:exodeoxyribonuclease VII large subunit